MNSKMKLGAVMRFANQFRALSPLSLAFGISAMAMAIPAQSQENPFVRVEMPDSDVSIEGELIDFDDEYYFIAGSIGTIRVPRERVVCIGLGCPGNEIEVAEDQVGLAVVLESIDGEMRLSGDLINVEEQHYIINNSLGEFRVLKTEVNCIGAACPVIEIYNPQFAIHAATPNIRFMMANLLSGYAKSNDQDYEVEETNGVPETVRLFSKDEHELIAEINLVIENPEGVVQVMSENTPDISILDMQQLSIQLANSDEVDAASLEQTLIAYDGMVIIGQRDNPVRSLGVTEINQIWNGLVGSWRALGGGDSAITLHMVNESSAASADAMLWLETLGKTDANGIITHDTEAEVAEAVRADRNAIGIVHRAAADVNNSKMLDMRRACGLTTSPSNFDMQVEQYPFTQPVYALARGASTHPVAQSFVAWVQGPEAVAHITQAGYVGTQLQRMKLQDMGVAVIHTAAVEPDFDGTQFAGMMLNLRDADRLSITFRFLAGSATLDDESIQNVKDLAERLRRSEFDGQEVMMVGFADSIGPADRNTVLSARRAEVVRDLLKSELDSETQQRLNITALSYGEQMPLDCNDTDIGRANNRRVEVWTKVAN